MASCFGLQAGPRQESKSCNKTSAERDTLVGLLLVELNR
jgi:hypothetical protein